MTSIQKIVIAILSVAALAILAGLVCAVIFFVIQPSASPRVAEAALAEQPAPAAQPSPGATPEPTPTATPESTATQSAEPSPTSTRVVVETRQPTPTPTRANCVDDVKNFEASGVITDEQIKQYLRDVIPLAHLDGCRGITYFAQKGKIHGQDIAGSIIPIYREIQVFAVDPEYQTADLILDTLTHEVGHNRHTNLRATDMAIDGRWAKLYQQSEEMYVNTGLGFISQYARTNKFEDFAESYMAYVRYPAILKSVNPDKYEFMRLEVFAGLEYFP